MSAAERRRARLAPAPAGAPPASARGRPDGAAPTVPEARGALREVDEVAASLGIFSTEYEGAHELPSVGERRRRWRAEEPDPVATVALVMDAEGVLSWQESASAPAPAGPRRRRRGLADVEGDLVELYQYEHLPPNEINRFLTALDRRLNPVSGLSRLEFTAGTGRIDRRPVARPGPAGTKRRLLLVHGTFGSTDGVVQAIHGAPNGAGFLGRAFAYYDEVLAFDHPTLSLSPVLNAVDLVGLMTRATGPLDVIAHSRGGLVTRWFLEGFGAARGDGPCRAVLVGAPLGGTSLASPPRLRDALSMLSNLGIALRIGGTAAAVYLPLLAAPLGLLRIATSVVTTTARTPVIDVAVSMIPGLAGQSRVALNHELDRLRAVAPARPPTYFVVQSNFESDAPGWRFWRWFRADALKGVAAHAVFPGENDLVVDTRSMTEFSPPGDASRVALLPPNRRHDFGTSARVHHTNYFEQAETLDFILDRLGVR